MCQHVISANSAAYSLNLELLISHRVHQNMLLFSYYINCYNRCGQVVSNFCLHFISANAKAYSLNLNSWYLTGLIKLPKTVISTGCYCFFLLLYICQHFISANSAAYSLNLELQIYTPLSSCPCKKIDLKTCLQFRWVWWKIHSCYAELHYSALLWV